jgi:hypothetical protein
MLGEIRLQPATDGGLWAEYRMSPGILLKGAGQVVGVTGFEPATYTSRISPTLIYTRLKLKIRQ